MGPKISQQVIDKLNSIFGSDRTILEDKILTIPKEPDTELKKRFEELKQQTKKK